MAKITDLSPEIQCQIKTEAELKKLDYTQQRRVLVYLTATFCPDVRTPEGLMKQHVEHGVGNGD